MQTLELANPVRTYVNGFPLIWRKWLSRLTKFEEDREPYLFGAEVQ
jgi:hypothetical protein